jgi:hypothetical protein
MSTTSFAILHLSSQANGAATVEVSSSVAAAQAGATRLTNNLSRVNANHGRCMKKPSRDPK